MTFEPGAPPEETARGCWRIVLPDPYPPGVVAVHLLESTAGPWLVDAGPPGAEARAALDEGLAALGLEREGLGGVLLSHDHLDHVGGLDAGQPARLRAHAATVRRLEEPAGGDAERTGALLRRAGVPADARERLLPYREPRDPSLSRRIRVAERLEGEEGTLGEPTGWRWLRARGHAPGHLLLHRPEDGTLLSSDQFMDRLKTPFDLGEPDADPWGAYRASLTRAAELEPAAIHPAHTDTIRPALPWLERRIGALDRALGRVREATEDGAETAWRVMRRLYPGDPGGGQQALLVRETLAGLRRLAAVGDAERRIVEGVERYRPA